MDLVTFFRFLRLPHEFTEAESSGSLAVHHDLVMWAISTAVADSVSILVDRMNVFSPERPIQRIVSALESLPSALRSKISVRSALSLGNGNTLIGPFVALGTSTEFVELAMLRDRLGRAAPVCGVIHSCLFPGVLTAYANVPLSSRRGDVLCATSTAAMQASNALLDQAFEFLERQMGSAPAYIRERLKVIRVPLGIDDSWVDSVDRQFARRTLRFSDDWFIALYFGRVSREYKADLAPLLLAFRKLRQSHSQARLVIAGSSVHEGTEAYLPALLRHYGLGETVIVLRNVSPEVKRLLFGASDILVAPADNLVESFGLSIIEAMGAGLPVVASNWSGYRDLVQDGRTGFLVETTTSDDAWGGGSVLAEFAITPHAEYFVAQKTCVDAAQMADRLKQLAGNTELRRRMGDAALEETRRFYVWSTAIRRFSEVWQEALQIASENEVPAGCALNLQKAFAAYPSSLWRHDCPLFVHASSLADEEFLSGIPMDSQTRSLLVSCRQGPKLLPLLVASGDGTRERLYWLLKRGFLTVSPVPPVSG